jgi:hypothetical protein
MASARRTPAAAIDAKVGSSSPVVFMPTERNYGFAAVDMR